MTLPQNLLICSTLHRDISNQIYIKFQELS